MSRGIKPGVMCLVLRSWQGNEGREVEAVRPVYKGELLPEVQFGLKRIQLAAWTAGWLVKAKYPLNFKGGMYHADIDPHFANFPASWLLPLYPGDKDLEVDTAAPVDTRVPSLTPA